MEHKRFVEVQRQLQEGNISDLFFQTEDGEVVRRFCPKERLILLGGGHVALPLAQIANMLDFSVIVVDDRPAFANSVRFPDADQVICDSFANAIKKLEISSEDYICIITRGHQYDAECLKTILSGRMPAYLGMLGSKRRVRAMKENLIQEGFEKKRLEEVKAPIGLDINALTTAEIAISITGEMIANRRNEKKKTIGFETEYLTQTNIDRELIRIAAEASQEMVLALVTKTSGSTPVKAGAMMLVGRQGPLAGTIGGGCKEAEVITLAREIVGRKEEKMITLSLSSDFEEEEGMVCGGRMTVYLTNIE